MAKVVRTECMSEVEKSEWDWNRVRASFVSGCPFCDFPASAKSDEALEQATLDHDTWRALPQAERDRIWAKGD